MALINYVGCHLSDSYVTLAEANDYLAGRGGIEAWNDASAQARERLLRQAVVDIDLFRYKGQKFFDGYPLSITAPYTTLFEFSLTYRQSLQFPRSWHAYFTGRAGGGSDTTVVVPELSYLNHSYNSLIGGTIYIITGSGSFSYSNITSYDPTTATFTVSPSFSDSVDTTSLYVILEAIPREVKFAQIEQALHICLNEVSRSRKSREEGILSETIGDVSVTYSAPYYGSDSLYGSVSPNAFRFLTRFIDRTHRLGRV